MQLSELKSVVGSMDTSSKDSALRLTRLSGQLDECRQALQRAEGERASLLGQIKERDSRVAALTSSLSVLDEERDRLQAQLDSIAESSDQVEGARVEAARIVADLKQQVQVLEQRLRQSNEELATARRHGAIAEGRISSLRAELEEMQRRLNLASSEVGGAAEDLTLMTRENQALTAELAEVSFERDRLRDRVGELSVVAGNLEEARRCVDVFILPSPC